MTTRWPSGSVPILRTGGTTMTPPDFHASLDAALDRTRGGEVSVDLTLDEADALVGDDIAMWLANPFMSPDLVANKVCWWLTIAVARAKAEERERVAAAIEAMPWTETARDDLLRIARTPEAGGR